MIIVIATSAFVAFLVMIAIATFFVMRKTKKNSQNCECIANPEPAQEPPTVQTALPESEPHYATMKSLYPSINTGEMCSELNLYNKNN